MSKNVLIIGCGSKLGANMSKCLIDRGYNIYGITGSTITNENIIHQKIDWDTVNITECEKFLRSLPEIHLIIFNQNSSALTEDCFKYSNTNVFEVWKRSKKWQQSHYVNCILPVHFLHSLAESKKLSDESIIIWMLSSAILDGNGPVDYIGQKFQNLQTLKRFAEYNKQIYLGMDPGTLDAEELIKFIESITVKNNGKFYSINKTSVIERC